ncbi:hypothetical protein DSO57_1025388 [Entomophthora muscae]|uniref:Uncharacterized protein n=1 Tax=Entomophthora muscae TaxID=34485 RepID=A0ACC2S423_9FUNG|nr:hypothetical protein DSO57_1025388 [Entomophthora muscae]
MFEKAGNSDTQLGLPSSPFIAKLSLTPVVENIFQFHLVNCLIHLLIQMPYQLLPHRRTNANPSVPSPKGKWFEQGFDSLSIVQGKDRLPFNLKHCSSMAIP